MKPGDAGEPESLARLRGRRILVVDDQPEVRRLVGRWLRGSGAEVVEAADAEIAWMLIRDRAPDLLVTDLQMPGPSGEQLAARVRAHYGALPIVLMTGGPATATGHANVLLRKPLQAEDLLNAAATLLE